MLLATVLDCVENIRIIIENCIGQHCLRAGVSGGGGGWHTKVCCRKGASKSNVPRLEKRGAGRDWKEWTSDPSDGSLESSSFWWQVWDVVKSRCVMG